MTRAQRSVGRAAPGGAALAVTLLVMVALAGSLGPAGADSASSAPARLVAQMRAASGDADLSGVVTVTWRAADGRREQATAEVRAVDGVVQVVSGGNVVVGEDDHTWFKDELGWTQTLDEPSPRGRPAPDAWWRLSMRATTFEGRPATVVVATRRDGTPAQRLTIDDETHLPLAREVLAPDGSVERSFRFVDLELAPTSPDTTMAEVPRASGRAAEPLTVVPDGFRAPEGAGAGYALVSRARHGDRVHLLYSDGLFSVSVVEQRGEVDWSAMPAGADADVDGARARRYVEPTGDVVVWERDGVVFTCVSDAPSDVLDAMIVGLTPDRSVAERVVDFVLGPFGFE